MTTHFDNDAVLRLTEQYDAEAQAYADHWAPIVHPVDDWVIRMPIILSSARCPRWQPGRDTYAKTKPQSHH